MSISYDKDADALYVEYSKELVARTRKVDEYTVLGFAENDDVVGVELLFVNERNPSLVKAMREQIAL